MPKNMVASFCEDAQDAVNNDRLSTKVPLLKGRHFVQSAAHGYAPFPCYRCMVSHLSSIRYRKQAKADAAA